MNKVWRNIFLCLLLVAVFMMPISAVKNEPNSVMCSMQPTIEWKKTFGGDECDLLYCIEQTIDGGYVACGITEESDNFYVWLLKLDSMGNEEWSVINKDLNGTVFTSSGNEHDLWAYYVMQTNDGGYIVSGFSMISVEIEGVVGWVPLGYLWKVDETGTTEWIERTPYGIEDQSLTWTHGIIELEDGYLTVGDKRYYNLEFEVINMDGFLVKTDTEGKIEWQKTYDTGGFDHLVALTSTSDGGYLLTGNVNNIFVSEGAFWMIKIDEEGNKQWDSLFDGPGFEFSHVRYCFQTSDGGYLMCGVTGSYGEGGTDIWVIKTDESGNMEWDKTFGGSTDDYCWCMDSTNDGGYLFGLVKNIRGLTGTRDDIWIITTDEEGNSKWKFQVEESGIQAPWTVSYTSDGGSVAVGRTANYGSPSSDGFVYKISSFVNQRPNKPSTPTGPSRGKPNQEYNFSTSASDPDGDQLFYRWDWGDGTYSEWLDTPEASYTWDTRGFFEVRVIAEDEHGGESDWSDSIPFSTPKIRLISQLLLQFLENHSHLFPIIRQILLFLG